MIFWKKRNNKEINTDGDVGLLISELRAKLGITQQELGELINASHKTVSKWENGNGFPELTYRKKLCEVFGITLEELHEGRIDYKRRKANKTVKVQLVAASFATGFLMALIIMLGSISLKDLTHTDIYFLESENANSTICEIQGLLIESDKANMLFIGDIDIWDYEADAEDIINVDFYDGNNLLYHSNKLSNIFFNYDSNNDINPNDIRIDITITDINNAELKLSEELKLISAYDVGSYTITRDKTIRFDADRTLQYLGFEMFDEDTYKKFIQKSSEIIEVTYIKKGRSLTYTSEDQLLVKNIRFDLRMNLLEVNIISKTDTLHTLIEKYTYNYNSKMLDCQSGTCATLDEALNLMGVYQILRYVE